MAKRPTPQHLYKQVVELRANKQPLHSKEFREIMHDLLDIMLDASELSFETTQLNALIQSAPYISIDETPVVLALAVGPPALIRAGCDASRRRERAGVQACRRAAPEGARQVEPDHRAWLGQHSVATGRERKELNE